MAIQKSATVRFISMSQNAAMVGHSVQRRLTMLHRSTLIRVLAIPACLVWGVTEFLALQRARLANRKLRAH
jgi:hypothetical protein